MTERQTNDLSSGSPLRSTRILIAGDDAILAFDMETVPRDAGAEVLGPASALADTLA